jgi:hypothetical protein
MSIDHISKYTWNNQMMISVKRKLAHAMSTCDVNKLHHSGRFTSGFFTTNKCQKSQCPEGRRSKVTLSRRSKIHCELGQPLDPGEEHVQHEEIHVSKEKWCNPIMTSVKLNRHFKYVKIMNLSDTRKLIIS